MKPNALHKEYRPLSTAQVEVVIEENGEVIHSPSPCVEITSLTPPGFATSSDRFNTSMGSVHFFILDFAPLISPSWDGSTSASQPHSISPPWDPSTSSSWDGSTSAPQSLATSSLWDLYTSPLWTPSTSPSWDGSTSPPQPQPTFSSWDSPTYSTLSPVFCQPTSPPQPQSTSGGSHQVPTLYNYFMNERSRKFLPRLAALRQAFTIILSNSQYCCYFSRAGRLILGGVTTFNSRNQLSSRTHMTSCCSLAEIRIQQFNFIDIIYELVLPGVLRGARPPVFPRPRGFLSHLMAMLYSISMVTEHRMPMAEEYMFHVKNEMFVLLGDIFSLKERVNADPWSLAATVWEHLYYHIQQLLEILLKPYFSPSHCSMSHHNQPHLFSERSFH